MFTWKGLRAYIWVIRRHLLVCFALSGCLTSLRKHSCFEMMKKFELYFLFSGESRRFDNNRQLRVYLGVWRRLCPFTRSLVPFWFTSDGNSKATSHLLIRDNVHAAVWCAFDPESVDCLFDEHGKPACFATLHLVAKHSLCLRSCWLRTALQSPHVQRFTGIFGWSGSSSKTEVVFNFEFVFNKKYWVSKFVKISLYAWSGSRYRSTL